MNLRDLLIIVLVVLLCALFYRLGYQQKQEDLKQKYLDNTNYLRHSWVQREEIRDEANHLIMKALLDQMQELEQENERLKNE